MGRVRHVLVAAVGVLAGLVCLAPFEIRAGAEERQHNALTAAEKAAGWRLLFDGTTTDQWRGYRQETLPAGWQAVDGALTRAARARDIVTRDQFADFDFAFDWQIAPGGNSGVMFYVTEAGQETYFSGPEYQVLDNGAHADGKNTLTSSGSCYALYAPVRDVTRPIGEWNEGRIMAVGGKVEHWLNGVKVVEYDMNSQEWKDKVANSKFDEWKQFGTARRGHIALQEHGSRVAYRNLKIREIKPTGGPAR